jgi:D-sedoheptulose 7-phosphate isomerase
MVRVAAGRAATGARYGVSGVVEVRADTPVRPATTGSIIAGLLAERSTSNVAFFAREAPRIAQLCARMSERFARGGRLIAIGATPAARSDVRHVTVEFVHPVIVGKRALPAVGLVGETSTLASEVALLSAENDIVFAFGSGDAQSPLARSISVARARGCLTIADDDQSGAEFGFVGSTDDPFIWQETVETLYHVLWELVHVFSDHSVERTQSAGSPGSAGFLYPFLTPKQRDLDSMISDVTRSARDKANETDMLRRQMLEGSAGDALAHAAMLVRERLDAGGTVLAFGNGGSATDAMDLVADLRHPPSNAGSPRPALDLSEDSAILSALANDVGNDVVFARQIIAYGRAADVAIGFSTSGSSRNVIAGLQEARRRGMLTIAFTGYDGGRIGAEELADHVSIAPSSHIPRIQEAHATSYHIFRMLLD